jgi:hypothetical protein
MEKIMEAPQKTLRIYPKKFKSGYYKATCTPMFIAALVTIAKLICSTTDEWIKKM